MSEATVFTADQFAKIIGNITRAGAQYSKGTGQALLGALYFSIVEKNAKPANELVQALRKSTKQQAVIDLLEENGNLAWIKQGKKVPGFEWFDAMQTWMPEDVEALRDTCSRWEDYKKVALPKDYDAIKAVEQIVKNIEAKQKKGQTVIGADIRQLLVEALAKRSAQVYGEAF